MAIFNLLTYCHQTQNYEETHTINSLKQVCASTRQHCLWVSRSHPIWDANKSREHMILGVNRKGPLKNNVSILIHVPLSKISWHYIKKNVIWKRRTRVEGGAGRGGGEEVWKQQKYLLSFPLQKNLLFLEVKNSKKQRSTWSS